MKTTQDCRRWREAIRSCVAEGSAGEEATQIQDHAAACADCRHYAEKLRAAVAGLRWLANQPANSSPGFRARWTRAVEDAALPRSPGQTMAALLDWCRVLVLRNRRPALAVGSLWILTLLFRLSAPDVSSPAPATAARSPVEIARALEGDQRLVAWRLRRSDPVPPAPRPAQPPQPRSQRLPARPAAQSDPPPDAHATVGLVPPGLIGRSDSPGSLPV
jgi:hypothetical protein